MQTALLSSGNIVKGIFALFISFALVSCKSDPKVDPDKEGEDEGGSYSMVADVPVNSFAG